MLTDMKSHVTDCEQQLKEQQDLRDKYKVGLMLDMSVINRAQTVSCSEKFITYALFKC